MEWNVAVSIRLIENEGHHGTLKYTGVNGMVGEEMSSQRKEEMEGGS